jgi:hypothetical protein
MAPTKRDAEVSAEDRESKIRRIIEAYMCEGMCEDGASDTEPEDSTSDVVPSTDQAARSTEPEEELNPCSRDLDKVPNVFEMNWDKADVVHATEHKCFLLYEGVRAGSLQVWLGGNLHVTGVFDADKPNFKNIVLQCVGTEELTPTDHTLGVQSFFQKAYHRLAPCVERELESASIQSFANPLYERARGYSLSLSLPLSTAFAPAEFEEMDMQTQTTKPIDNYPEPRSLVGMKVGVMMKISAVSLRNGTMSFTVHASKIVLKGRMSKAKPSKVGRRTC